VLAPPVSALEILATADCHGSPHCPARTVFVGDGVMVGVTVADGVVVEVGVLLEVGVCVGVVVKVALGPGVLVRVMVAVRVTVRVSVGVGVRVPVGVTVKVRVGVLVGVMVAAAIVNAPEVVDVIPPPPPVALPLSLSEYVALVGLVMPFSTIVVVVALATLAGDGKLTVWPVETAPLIVTEAMAAPLTVPPV
jgi:hypothetical protein